MAGVQVKVGLWPGGPVLLGSECFLIIEADNKMRARAVSILAKMQRWAGIGAIVAVGGAAMLSASGCAIGDENIRRWETTEHGPEKLFAIVTHDKYALDLRAHAALSLVHMKPRAGQRVGLNELLHALESVRDDERAHILAAIAPKLIEQIEKPAPAKGADGKIPPDESTAYKDAAFGLLAHEPTLVSDDTVKKSLIAALTKWVQTSFETRIDNPGQAYGVEQMMRYIGPQAAAELPASITETSTKIDRAVALLADLGHEKAKVKGSEALVTLAKAIDAKAWVEKQKPLAREANAKSGAGNVSEKELEKQLVAYQEQELEKVFVNMRRLGGRPAVAYCIAYGKDTAKSEKMRTIALAAIENHVDKDNKADIETIYDIIREDKNPDSVRGLAIARLGELPKDQVVGKLYSLFESHKWQVRLEAAKLVLKSATLKDIPEFMKHLPVDSKQKMALSEALAYGALIMAMPNEGANTPKATLTPFLSGKELGPKLVAVAASFQAKKSAMLPLAGVEGDTAPMPKCETEDGCGWTCVVPKAGSQQGESKAILTVGDFVKLCIEPSTTAG